MKNSNNYYSTTEKIKQSRIRFAVALIVLGAVIALAGYLLGTYILDAGAEDAMVKAYAMCTPGSRVNVRRVPSKSAQEVGYLESGDAFLTDGTSSDGWIRCYGIGEFGEGWVYCGYVVTEEPRVVMSNYICASNGRVACRRWMGGPKVANRPWIANGSTVTVFYIADEWACTSRGYILAEYLEADPE